MPDTVAAHGARSASARRAIAGPVAGPQVIRRHAQTAGGGGAEASASWTICIRAASSMPIDGWPGAAGAAIGTTTPAWERAATTQR